MLGSNAEAFLLTREERITLIKAARSAIGSFPLMAGVGQHSTAQVLRNIKDAQAAGADYVLVLPPAYFSTATTRAVIIDFFSAVAEASPLPIVIYNFPGVCNGIDLDSELITQLALKYPQKIVGVKLTCGSVAKIVRLTAKLSKEEFVAFGGQSDFIIGALASGAAGCIAAFANVAPKTIVRIYHLYSAGKHEQALRLHRQAALAETAIKPGIAATKYAAAITTAKEAGIEDAPEKLSPRKPYQPLHQTAAAEITNTLAKLHDFEKNDLEHLD